MLTKLRYDESVNGYALITNDGQPFLSFSLPDEALPPIQGALRIHESSLRLMNIMTDAGTVVLARVAPEWILGVLFEPTESLGSALQKVKDVAFLRMLRFHLHLHLLRLQFQLYRKLVQGFQQLSIPLLRNPCNQL